MLVLVLPAAVVRAADSLAARGATPRTFVFPHVSSNSPTVRNSQHHPAGHELRGHCPIHRVRARMPSTSTPTKTAFQCFSCQAKGNVLDFVATMEKCSVRDAGLKLQERFGVTGGPLTAGGGRAQARFGAD
jgi:hypothetical protein